MQPTKLDIAAAPYFDITAGPIIPILKRKAAEIGLCYEEEELKHKHTRGTYSNADRKLKNRLKKAFRTKDFQNKIKNRSLTDPNSYMEDKDNKDRRIKSMGQLENALQITGLNRNIYPQEVLKAFSLLSPPIKKLLYAVNKRGNGQRWAIIIFETHQLAACFLKNCEVRPLIYENLKLKVEPYKWNNEKADQKFRIVK